MEIRCRKCDCTFNTGSSCKARAIKVCRDTAECVTYTRDAAKENVVVKNGNLFEAAKDLSKKNTNNVPLRCSATNCLFNKKENCIANGILVEENKACCATFTKV